MNKVAVTAEKAWKEREAARAACERPNAVTADAGKRERSAKRLIEGAAGVCHFLFVAIILFQFFPDRRPDESHFLFPASVALIEAIFLLYLYCRRGNETVAGDLLALVYGAVFVWQLLTVKFDVLDRMLFPSPTFVLSLLVHEIPEAVKGAISSLGIVFVGYGTALITAVPLGLIAGWNRRLRSAATPITRVLGPVPPTVYIPYAIVLLPTFKLSSMFVIFIGAFWPIFINTLNGVSSIDGRIIESAKVLKLDQRTMLTKVIFPGTLPSVVSGATIGLAMSFILLTAAEMIGATSGLGWYVKYFSDFADYPRVIVGIIFAGIVVTCIMYTFDKVEKRMLRWRR
ncbi:MAG: putative aliphatic sulfonates transport permease protein SsuC [Syntrophorhabdaceae bacterium PtaU1.Bin034]|nr:MAG: putative aliphatic sulfonates transport permease protein SsuC [Syntrophorhabdaceae bacterium PtaU1.Bin034]